MRLPSNQGFYGFSCNIFPHHLSIVKGDHMNKFISFVAGGGMDLKMIMILMALLIVT